MDLHHQYAARKISGGDPAAYMYGYGASLQYIALNAEGDYTLTTEEKEAHTAWTRGLAARMIEDYVKKAWNVTMGDKPQFEIVKVKRPAKIHHPW